MIKGNVTAKPIFSEPLKNSQESSSKEALTHALSLLSESLERNFPKLWYVGLPEKRKSKASIKESPRLTLKIPSRAPRRDDIYNKCELCFPMQKSFARLWPEPDFNFVLKTVSVICKGLPSALGYPQYASHLRRLSWQLTTPVNALFSSVQLWGQSSMKEQCGSSRNREEVGWARQVAVMKVPKSLLAR